jgi:histidinol-phosphate phosphatase family protein
MNQVVIAVGGRGERTRPQSDVIPKPLFVFNGETFLAHLVSQFASCGATKFLLLGGYLSNLFEPEVRELEKKFRVTIEIHTSPIDMETSARLLAARDLLEKNFVFLYGDVYLPLHTSQIIKLLESKFLCLSAYQGQFRPNNRNMLINDGSLIEYRNEPFGTANGINCGYFLLDIEILDLLDVKLPLEKSLLFTKHFLESSRVIVSENKYYTAGDPQRRAMAEVFFSKKKTVLFDRDGTLFRGLGPAEYHLKFSHNLWKLGSVTLLKRLVDSGFQIGLITNQPSVGNGKQALNEMLDVNRDLVRDLSSYGVRFNVICICSHGWEEGCNCRKPKAGLMYEAQHLLDLNWESTLYVGDMERDAILASTVGCGFIYLDSFEAQIDESLFDRIQEYFDQNG